MRTIRNSGGYSGYVQGRLLDANDADLSVVTVKVYLQPEGETVADFPISTSTDWVVPEVLDAGVGRYIFRLLVTGVAPGTYRLWVQVIDGSEREPIVALDEWIAVV